MWRLTGGHVLGDAAAQADDLDVLVAHGLARGRVAPGAAVGRNASRSAWRTRPLGRPDLGEVDAECLGPRADGGGSKDFTEDYAHPPNPLVLSLSKDRFSLWRGAGRKGRPFDKLRTDGWRGWR